jgi:hypothetical protein
MSFEVGPRSTQDRKVTDRRIQQVYLLAVYSPPHALRIWQSAPCVQPGCSVFNIPETRFWPGLVEECCNRG